MPNAKRRNIGRKSVKEGTIIKRRKTAKGKDNDFVIPRLNTDIMINIFSRINADFLHQNFRYQCKEWFDLLSNPSYNEAIFLNSNPGLIVQERYDSDDDVTTLAFIELKGSDFYVRKLNTLKGVISIISSCKGLVLVQNIQSEKQPALFILNPSTNESVTVPSCKHKQESLWHHLVYVPFTKEYKLVDMYCDSYDIPVFHIRSIGGSWKDSYQLSDKLKNIQIVGSYNSILADIYWNQRISIEGILYVNTGYKIASFDLHKKSVEILELPSLIHEPVSKSGRLVELGVGILCLVLTSTGEFNPLMDLWILNDTSTGNWERRYRINGFTEYYKTPFVLLSNTVGSLNDGEILVFVRAGAEGIITYNMSTGEWKQPTLRGGNCRGVYRDCYHVHVSNLKLIG